MKCLWARLISILFFGFVASPQEAQPDDGFALDQQKFTRNLDLFMNRALDLNLTPGLAICVVYNSEFSRHMGNMVAAYAYDLILKRDFDERFREELDYLSDRRGKLIRRISERKQQAYRLSLPISRYAGSFDNAELGSLSITVGATNQLVIRFGQSRALLEPHRD